jgi:hypothetical protein
MSQRCHNQKFATAIGSSQFVQARKLRRPKENPPQSTSADCRAWKVSSIKRSSLSCSFFAFMSKDATAHHRRYTPGTPDRNTPNGGGRKHQRRSHPRSRCLLEHRGTRRCRRAPHRRRGAPRRRPGLQLLTRVTGPSLVQYQVSTFRVVQGFGCRPREGRRRVFGGRRPK